MVRPISSSPSIKQCLRKELIMDVRSIAHVQPEVEARKRRRADAPGP